MSDDQSGTRENLIDRVKRWVEEALEGLRDALDQRSPVPVRPPPRPPRRPRR